MQTHRQFLWLCGVVAAIAVALLIYSQTKAFTWDEGFHLLAAQLIEGGKRPYLDFFFPQTPLNAYWNAGWMRIFDDSWRVVHAVAALATSGAVLLTADFVFTRFPASPWRLAAALAAAVLVGANVLVVQFGTIGQAYGLCLLLVVAAFRLAILAVGRKSAVWALGAGFLAAAAAGSSLLTAPVAPVLLLWLMFYNREGSRWQNCAVFVAGGALAFLPVLALAVQGLPQTVFDIFKYHLFYRDVEWEGAGAQNINVLFSWIDSAHALILGALALAGLLFTVRREVDRIRRSEFYLCFWLAAALAVYLATAHPTFERYYLLIVPFLAIPAAFGLYEISSRLNPHQRTLWPLLALSLLLCLGLGKALYERHEQDNYSWPAFEAIAKKIDQVTPPGAPLFADEHFYFLTRRPPPSGTEYADAQKIDLPPPLSASLHLVPRKEWARRIQAGMFSTVETCRDEDDERFQVLGVPPLYRRKAVMQDCTIFWDWARRKTGGY
ncbi:MAG TPA: hypothetical protein VMH80_19815 [Bryobacteraceae bacterium]|nr:hypothetical protein [Bryobacteraceae bacterium]